MEQPVLFLKDMETSREQNCYYLLHKTPLKIASLMLLYLLYSKLISFTRQRLMSCICSVKQTQEHSQSQRFKSRGMNEEVKYAWRSCLHWTVHPHTGFRFISGRFIKSNKRSSSFIHSVGRVSRRTSIRISQWIISRTTWWFRHYSNIEHHLRNLHDAVDGRFTHGDLFTNHKTIIRSL